MKSSQRKVWIALAIVIVTAAAAPKELTAQPSRYDANEHGVFNEFSDLLGQIIALEFREGKMRLRRDFEDRRSQKQRQRASQPKTLRDRFVLAYLDLGYNESNASVRADARLKRMNELDIQVLEEDPELLNKVLRNLPNRKSIHDKEATDAIGYVNRVIAKRVRSNSYSGGSIPEQGAPHRLSFSGGYCIGRIYIDQKTASIEFLESYGKQRRLTVREDADGEFYFGFSHDGLLAELRQSANGESQLVWMEDGFIEAVSEKSCFDLFSRSDCQAKHSFLKLLDGLGVLPPFSEHDSKVMDAAIKNLMYLTPENRDEFAKLLVKLDAEKFLVRNQATEQLADDGLKWAYFMQEQLQDGTSSPEILGRLKKIVPTLMISDVDRFVIENHLLGSPSFLVRLLQDANDPKTKKLIVEQLEYETQLDHGSNLEAWKNAILNSK